MPSKWKFPRYGESWSECQWCGQLYPSSQVWLNPRYGWQCYKCWDGLIQRDQILQPIFPFEGTRRTPSPVTNTLTEGVGGPLEPTYDYFLRDRITGTVYDVHFTPFGIVNGVIVYFTNSFPTLTVSNETNNVWDGLRGVTNGWDVYVRNGVLATEINNDLNLEIVDGICDFGTGTLTGPFLLFDRAYPSDVWTLVFSDVITVTEASGPAAAGILLNDGWNFFIQGDGTPGGGLARYDQVPYNGDILWDNSHTFFVDETAVQPILRYAP